ncbi:DUF4166 domain-containing protein [Sphingomonas montana]|uniref:DUF4166 domain-containing protein n=1 Tax=Sphingomonas montana TaxID=1843236 RepID=UPI0009F85D29|nr:DUF4166 domain-containing protein [Sphingomonas montana]
MVTPSLFRRLLGPAIDAMAPALRAVHDSDADQILSGFATIEASRDPVARLLCRVMRLPAPGSDVPVTVRFARRGGIEHWHRTFGDRHYNSTLHARRGLLVERMGPATNVFHISVVAGALHLDLIGFRFLGIPLPRHMRPACNAVERDRDGAFTFDIPVGLPGLGRVIHYCGRLETIHD